MYESKAIRKCVSHYKITIKLLLLVYNVILAPLSEPQGREVVDHD